MPKKDPIGLKGVGNGDNAFDEEEQKVEEVDDPPGAAPFVNSPAPIANSPAPLRSTTTRSKHHHHHHHQHHPPTSLSPAQYYSQQQQHIGRTDNNSDIKPPVPNYRSRTSRAMALGFLPTFKDQVTSGDSSLQMRAVPSVEGTPVVVSAEDEPEPRTLPAVVLETLDGGALPRINAKNTVGTFAVDEQGGGTDAALAGTSNEHQETVTAELMDRRSKSSSRRSDGRSNKHLIWAVACVFIVISIVVSVVVSLVLLNSKPSSSSETKLTASDGASLDFFGYSAAISVDTIVIGAYNDTTENGFYSGSAYVYTRSSSGNDVGNVWTAQAKLTASDGATGDLFGYSVAIDGDTIAVGAIRDDDQDSNSGSTYIYSYIGSSSSSGTVMMWTEQAKLTADDGAKQDLFGSSVAISGDSIVIGSPGDDDSGLNSGSAYIFARSSGITGSSFWTQQSQLAASDGFTSDRFGDSVAMYSDSVIIGAPSVIGDASGSAYIYVRSGMVWTEQAKLTASDGAASDDFGQSVAIWGDWAVIGANEDDDNGSNSGSAFIYSRSGTTWTEQTKLLPSDGSAHDYFGFSVAMSGDIVVVGAYRDGDNGNDSGSAYAFVRSGSTWSEQAKLTASDGSANDNFGSSVSIDEDSVVIGANQDADSGSASGSAYAIDLNQIL